jgi:hypothetical protein
MDQLLNKLQRDIEDYNNANPSQQIKWEIRRDKLREIIKKEFSIPDKFMKKGSHQSNKYLSRDDVKHLDSLLNELAGYAERQRIVVSGSRSRSISRSGSRSGSRGRSGNRTRNGTRNINAARRAAQQNVHRRSHRS